MQRHKSRRQNETEKLNVVNAEDKTSAGKVDRQRRRTKNKMKGAVRLLEVSYLFNAINRQTVPLYLKQHMSIDTSRGLLFC